MIFQGTAGVVICGRVVRIDLDNQCDLERFARLQVVGDRTGQKICIAKQSAERAVGRRRRSGADVRHANTEDSDKSTTKLRLQFVDQREGGERFRAGILENVVVCDIEIARRSAGSVVRQRDLFRDFDILNDERGGVIFVACGGAGSRVVVRGGIRTAIGVVRDERFIGRVVGGVGRKGGLVGKCRRVDAAGGQVEGHREVERERIAHVERSVIAEHVGYGRSIPASVDRWCGAGAGEDEVTRSQ